jgi:hypothetical protein
MMRNQIANFWNSAAQFFLSGIALALGDLGFVLASRRSRLGRLRLFDCDRAALLDRPLSLQKCWA